jgi:hypothetical protein
MGNVLTKMVLEISHILSREELVGLANIIYGNVNMFKTILNNKVVLVYIFTFPFWKKKKIVLSTMLACLHHLFSQLLVILVLIIRIQESY